MNINESMTDRSTRERMTSTAHNAIDKAADLKDQAAEWVSERTDQLGATQKKLVENTTRYVSDNPIKSLGFAVLAALVVGRLMK